MERKETLKPGNRPGTLWSNDRDFSRNVQTKLYVQQAIDLVNRQINSASAASHAKRIDVPVGKLQSQRQVSRATIASYIIISLLCGIVRFFKFVFFCDFIRGKSLMCV